VKAVYAPDLLASPDPNQPNADHWITGARITAGICQSDLDADYRRRVGLLEEKIQEEEQKKGQALYAQRQRTVLYITGEVLLGLILTIGLVASLIFFVQRTSSLFYSICGGIIAVGVVMATGIVIYWTLKHQSKSQETLSNSTDFAINSLRQQKEELRPVAQCLVGNAYWGLQLVPHRNHATLFLDLALSAVKPPVSLVSEPLNKNQRHTPVSVKEGQSDPFTELLDGFDQFASEAKDWTIISVQFPLISKDVPMAENLAREITTLLKAHPGQPIGRELLIFHNDGSLEPLELGCIAHLEPWQKCYQNASAWRAYFKKLTERAHKTTVRALEILRHNSEDRLKVNKSSEQPNSIWANLSVQRPDVKGLLNDLQMELDHLALELGGGIDHVQRQGLLAELRKAMDQAHLRPWPEQWTRHIADLNQRSNDILRQVNAISSELKEFSGAVSHFSSQFNLLSDLRMDDQLAQINSSLQQTGQNIERLRGSYVPITNPYNQTTNNNKQSPILNRILTNKASQASQPQPFSSYGTAPSVDQTQQLAASLSRVTTELNGIQVSLSNLKESSRFTTNQLADYEQRINQMFIKLVSLSEQMTRIIALVEEDQRQRGAAIAEYESRIQLIEDAYARQVEEARAKAYTGNVAMEGTRTTVNWLTYQPEVMVLDLIGVDKRSIEDLSNIRASNTILDAIDGRIQAALEKESLCVSELCNQRIQHIDDVYRLVQQALKVDEDLARDVEVILIPVWYVEWCEAQDPEELREKRIHFYLTTPVQRSTSPEGNPLLIPMYPAIAQYMRSVSPGIWSGIYSPGQEPLLAKAVHESAILHEVQL
jgi:hypothetical protein